MKDRERILMNIAIATSGSCHDQMSALKNGWCIRTTFGKPSPQFLPLDLCNILQMPLEEGDIVRCETNRKHPWSISQFVKINSEDGGYFGSKEYLCREIGGDKLCRIHNESLSVLRFISKPLLYSGKEKQVYDWGHKAFTHRYNPDADRLKRCGGVEVKPQEVIIYSRAHIFAQERTKGDKTLYAQPRKFVVPWNKKTRLKDIIEAIRAQGFASDYEYGETEPSEGMGGCVKMTRDSLVNNLEAAGIQLKSNEEKFS